MVNKLIKIIFLIIMMLSLIAFISCNKITAMIIFGITLWISILMISEVVIEKKNIKKVEVDKVTVYLIDSKILSNNFCRTIGIINPIIVFDSNFFYSISYETQKSLVFHELYHVMKKHNLKRFLLFGLFILLYILSKWVMEKGTNLEFLFFGIILIYMLLFIIYCRKNEFNADLFSVAKSNDSKHLVKWLTIQAERNRTYTLSIHPSFKRRIKNINSSKHIKLGG